VALVDQLDTILRGLEPGWGDARLRLRLAEGADAERASALLGPLSPYRTGGEIRFHTVSGGIGPRTDAVERALRRLDRERIGGTLELAGVDAQPAAPQVARGSLADEWEAALATLPPDWSDMYAEVRFPSSDYVPRAALDMSPLNPRRSGGSPALAFRVARTFGYGAAPEMVRRCLERCDADGITGHLHVLRVLSDTRPVHTQGPVWYVGGRTI
jgi:hypothetical protein